jgi:CYTH domain-containing protein
MAQEIEHKFLVLDDSYKREAYHSYHIRQGYLTSGGGRSVRIRTRDGEAFITVKGPSMDGGLSRYEFEQPVPLDDARYMLDHLCEPGIIDKTRWLVRCGEHTWEVDEFHGDNEGLVVAEVELRAADEHFDLPPFIGRRVTGERRYYNSQLRRQPFKSW